jgi:hypothetical protein
MRVLFLLSLFISLKAVSQKEDRVLKGYLGIEGGESFEFKIQFSDSAGYLKGYTYAWLEENKQVKSSMTGYLDRQNKALSFKETRILSNKGFKSNATICLIQASLSYRKDGSMHVFRGPITSNDMAQVSCSRGSVVFPDQESLNELFKEPDSFPPPEKTSVVSRDAKSKSVRIIYDTSSYKPVRQFSPVFEIKQPEKLTAGTEKILDWVSDSLVIEIWDTAVDGDIVSVLLNGKSILNNYVLSHEKKRIVLPVSPGRMDMISIVAENTGNQPPNTASVLLTDGFRTHEIIAYNDAGKSTIIKIKKVLSP